MLVTAVAEIRIMTERLYTFAEMAALISKADGRPGDDAKAIQQQIRGAHQRGLVKERDHAGPRGAIRVTLEEFCRVRLLLVLIDFGVEGDELARANAMLSDGGRHVSPDGVTLEHSLKGLIAATRNGGTWVLRVNMVRDRLEGGALRFSVKLLPSWQAARPIKGGEIDGDPMHPETDAQFIGATHLAFMKIPASDLIAPLLSAA